MQTWRSQQQFCCGAWQDVLAFPFFSLALVGLTLETLKTYSAKEFSPTSERYLHYLSLIRMLVKRELKVKYRGSFLGYLWSMLNPLLFMLILSMVFSFMMKGTANYNLYVLSGILFWNLTSLSINLGTTSIVQNALLLQKVRVPIWIFPLVPVGLGISNLCLSLIPYTIVFLIQGMPLPEQWYLAPLMLVATLLFLSGVSLGLSSVNVLFRDVAHVLEPVLMLCFYATPIIYDRSNAAFPAKISRLLDLNPFTHFVEGFRAAIFGGPHFSGLRILLVCGMAAVSMIAGITVHRAIRPRIMFNL